MRQLNIDVRQYGQPEGISENIEYALGLGLPELQMAPCKNDSTFVIVGSSPFVEDHIEEVKQETGPICGIKGAYDFLIEHDIIPDLYLSVEPRYRPVKHPHKQSVFLLASRVNKQLFDDLKDRCVYLWHSWSGEDDYDLSDKMCIGGGTTSGLRAVNVAYLLGFRKFKFYGMDSCLGEKGEKRVNQPPLGKDVQRTDVIVGGRRFLCNMAMAAQAQDFQFLYDIMPDITIDIAGDGLLKAIVDERKRQGKRT